ncbi:hypothetical protein CC78DRAFT_586388 [Lojkania enalia]|uniref:Uncharacterized protein n=1 Tax=Lojkania enalia TaxID=147567 RepID=A0A9P4MZ22_9PLEO|nr:hypothetical protein CC78DRAFT_586388 [Didymosphaeria enalia]
MNAWAKCLTMRSVLASFEHKCGGLCDSQAVTRKARTGDEAYNVTECKGNHMDLLSVHPNRALILIGHADGWSSFCLAIMALPTGDLRKRGRGSIECGCVRVWAGSDIYIRACSSTHMITGPRQKAFCAATRVISAAAAAPSSTSSINFISLTREPVHPNSPWTRRQHRQHPLDGPSSVQHDIAVQRLINVVHGPHLRHRQIGAL